MASPGFLESAHAAMQESLPMHCTDVHACFIKTELPGYGTACSDLSWGANRSRVAPWRKPQAVVPCVDSLFKLCEKDNTQLRMLNNLLSPISIKIAFDPICQDMTLFNKANACIKQYRPSVYKCTGKAMVAYRQNPLSVDEIKMGSVDRLCTFFERAVECAVSEMRKCSKTHATRLEISLRRLAPPTCFAG